MPKVVFTRPDYEIVTHYLFVWSQKLVSEAKKNKWTVTDLRKSQATIAKFTAAVGKTSPALILLHGHGNYSSISGHNGKVIIQAGQNENILKNAVIIKPHHSDTVGPGATVVISKNGDEKIKYQIVGSEEVDMSAGRISISSPIGKAMFGKKKGDEFQVELPNGNTINYKVVEVE